MTFCFLIWKPYKNRQQKQQNDRNFLIKFKDNPIQSYKYWTQGCKSLTQKHAILHISFNKLQKIPVAVLL